MWNVLRKRVLPVLDVLERRLMFAFAELNPQGIIVITGTSTNNQITVTNNSTFDPVTVTMDGSSLQFPDASVKGVSIDAGAGDDVVVVAAQENATILGGDGNDSLVGGSDPDSLDGGAGNDTLNGGAEDDWLTGGDGIDMFDYGDRPDGYILAVYAEPVTPQPPLPCGGDYQFHAAGHSIDDEDDYGTDMPEIVIGSKTGYNDFGISSRTTSIPSPITVFGGGGDDVFDPTNDLTPYVAFGGPGEDSFGKYTHTGITARPPTLLGGPGNDRFEQGDVGEVIDGGAGGDAIIGGESGGTIDLSAFVSVENVIGAFGSVTGNNSANYISLAAFTKQPARRVSVSGSGGNDTIVGSHYGDHLSGGDGDDVISGGGGADKIYGGNGNDVINGNSGNDHIWGGAGNDTLIGGPGRDHLYGEAGDDYLNTRDNKIDTFYGGEGDDIGKVDHSKVNDIYHDIEKLI